MSGTRHAAPGGPFRQERYASSLEYDRGLMANLVAKRCSALKNDDDRALVWWLQSMDVEKLAADLIDSYPERLVTPSMGVFGCRPGQKYNVRQVSQIRGELFQQGEADPDVKFPLRGDPCMDDLAEGWSGRVERPADDRPTFYEAQQFGRVCRDQASKSLANALRTMALDPALQIDSFSPWYFLDLPGALRAHRKAWIERRRAGLVITSIGAIVEEELEYCLKSRRLVLIHGFARTGKTYSARKWCDLHPGIARYAEVPPGASDIGFFRAIAESLGVSINLNSKAHQLRDRCEAVLFSGQQMLLLDEAHRLFPESNYRDALPFRLSWIMMLVNRDVPVALITTKQFFKAQQKIERKTGWASDQFEGRVLQTTELPDKLSRADMESVARALLPEGDDKSIDLVVTYAEGSAKYLAGIEAAIIRSRYLAEKQGRQNVNRSDIKEAIKSAVIPSDAALSLARSEADPRSGARRHGSRLSHPLQTPSKGPAGGLKLEPQRDFSRSQADSPLSVRGRGEVALPLVEA